MNWSNIFSGPGWMLSGFIGFVALFASATFLPQPLPVVVGLVAFLGVWYYLLTFGGHLVCPTCNEQVSPLARRCPHCTTEITAGPSRRSR